MSDKAKHAAFVMASLSVALSVLGSMRAVATFRANLTPFNRADIVVLVWMALPMTLGVAGMISSLSRWMGPIWLCTGGLFGFVILAAWSLGLFYAYAALTMFVAALVHLTTVRPRWRTLFAPLWLLDGAAALAAVFFVGDALLNSESMQVTHAPAVVWGTSLFVAASMALLFVYALAAVLKPSRI
jgi:hypothetical protein